MTARRNRKKFKRAIPTRRPSKSKSPTRDQIQQNYTPTRPTTIHKKILTILADTAIAFVSAPHTHGVKQLIAFFRYAKQKKGKDDNLNNKNNNHNNINLHDDDTEPSGVGTRATTDASNLSAIVPKVMQNLWLLFVFLSGPHADDDNKDFKQDDDGDDAVNDNNKKAEQNIFRKFGFRFGFLSEPFDADDDTAYNEKKKKARPALLLTPSERMSQTRENSQQKLHYLLHAPGLSYRIFRWVSIILFLASPPIFIWGIIPGVALWMIFGDMITFALNQGREQLTTGHVPQHVAQAIRDGVRDTQESDKARKKYLYAAGVANKVAFQKD